VTEFKSEIRSSDIDTLEDKVGKGNYAKYLKRIVLRKVRAFSEREVNFDFPSRLWSALTAEVRRPFSEPLV